VRHIEEQTAHASSEIVSHGFGFSGSRRAHPLLIRGQCSSGQQAATATLRAHTNNITSLVFAPDGRTLTSGKKLGRFVVPRATVVSSGRKLYVVDVTGSNQAAIETGEARDWFG